MEEQMFETINDRINDFANLWTDYVYHDKVKLSDKFLNYLTEGGFFTAPASTKYHGAYEGGLYEHSRAVFLRLNEITENMGLKWQRPESPFIVGMFHDLCKCDQYIKVEGSLVDVGSTQIQTNTGYHYEYNKDTLLKGHGSKSVMILSQYLTLTEEELLCIRYHMAAYEKDEWQELDAAIRRTELILYSHLADMLASKIDGT